MPREHRNKNRKVLNCDSFANTIWHCLAPCNEFRNPANFCVWNPESSKVCPRNRNPGLGIPLKMGIRNPSSTGIDLESLPGIRNESLAWNPESKTVLGSLAWDN